MVKTRKNLNWWQILICYFASSVLTALLAGLVADLSGEETINIIVGDLGIVAINTFTLWAFQKIFKTRTSRTVVMLMRLTLSAMSYYGNGLDMLSIIVQISITGAIYYFALLWGETPQELAGRKATESEEVPESTDTVFQKDVDEEPPVPPTTRTQHVSPIVQENEALRIMQEAQLPPANMGQTDAMPDSCGSHKTYKKHAIVLSVVCGFLVVSLLCVVSAKDGEISQLENKLANKEKTIEKYDDMLNFFNNYCVIEYESDPGYYHKLNCPKDTAAGSFWMYNISAAESNGLKACVQCKNFSTVSLLVRQP